MKPRHKIRTVCIFLLTSLFLCGLPLSSAPGSSVHISDLRILNYNVAGLPKLFGNKAEDVRKNQRQIGKLLAAGAYDIIAVQEDFGYHDALMGYDSSPPGLADYPYTTVHSGGAPGGDGLNVWSVCGIYNEKRVTWDAAYGVIDHGADEMTPKGILYTLIDLGGGVYLDLYNIHADAGGDEGSIAAREVQFRQLADLIEEISGTGGAGSRPVIVTGDFNTSIHHENDSGLYENLMLACGLTDAWIELHNGGSCEDFSKWETDPTIKRWDGIEKFLYRDGVGVEIEPTSFKYEYILGEDGLSLSDHPAAAAVFSVEIGENFEPYEGSLKVVSGSPLMQAFGIVKTVLADIVKLLTHLNELVTYIRKMWNI